MVNVAASSAKAASGSRLRETLVRISQAWQNISAELVMKSA
jgi:hypothetical protein